MPDPVIRPTNGVLLIALQSAEGVPAAPSAATDAIPFEADSPDFNSPFKTEDSNEVTGSFDAGAPLVVGQPATIAFRSRLKGAGPGITYTASIKPPLHAALSICGWLGVFTASVSAAALTAGTTSSGTLGTGFASTAQQYRGMPLILTGAPAAGRMPLVSDYSAAKLAKLTDLYGTALSVSNTAELPANWTYAPTSPRDSSERASMNPCATVWLYEDGVVHKWIDCRGMVDLDGNSARPGYGAFSLTGIYVGREDAAVPSNPVYPRQSAPMLLQGAGAAPAIQIAGKPLPVSKWSLKTNVTIESPDDPNTQQGFQGAQLADRGLMLEIDPLMTLVATRNLLTDIAAFTQYAGGLLMPAPAGNRVSLALPLLQPVEATPAMRGKLRAETQRYRALNPGRDNAGRDGPAILCFS